MSFNEMNDTFGELVIENSGLKTQTNDKCFEENSDKFNTNSKQLKNKNNFSKHLIIETNSNVLKVLFICCGNDCNEVFESEDSLKEHKRTHQKSIESFESEDRLKESNNKSEDTIEPLIDKPFIDSNIRGLPRDESFVSQTIDSNKAQKPIKTKVISQKSDSKPKDWKPFECDFTDCIKTFKTRRLLKSHLISHSNEYPFSCDQKDCHYRTRTRNAFNVHMISHRNDCQFSCDEKDCQYTTKRRGDLNKHMNTVHSSDGIHKCTFNGCEKTFKTMPYLRVHLKTHRTLHSCRWPDCQFTTDKEWKLRDHRNSVHKNIQPFKCSVEGCVKTFKKCSDLKQHLNGFHSTERNYKCPTIGCDKSYKVLAALWKHKLIHSNREFPCLWTGCEYRSKDREQLKNHEMSHKTERNFVCHWPQCVKRFKTKRHLTLHLCTHNSDKPYVCHWPGCEYRCCTANALHKHMKTHKKS